MTSATGRYHHGDLPNALRRAAVEVIDEKGVAGFSLREVARRAGVSHAAPAHHFGDTTGLLTSLAVEAMEKLYEAELAATEGVDDPEHRLVAVGRAYVELGLRHPAHCEIAFRGDVVDCSDPAYQDAGGRAYGVLEDTIRAIAAARNPDLDVGVAARLCWSSVQGLLVLYPNMVRMAEARGEMPEPPADLAERFTEMLLAGMSPR